MSGLRNITMFPFAQGKTQIPDKPRTRGETKQRGKAMEQAWKLAVIEFIGKYGREPEYDIVFFRGCVTTFDVLVEIWEEA